MRLGKARAGDPALSLLYSLASQGLVSSPLTNIHNRAPEGSNETSSVKALGKLVQGNVSSCVLFPGT